MRECPSRRAPKTSMTAKTSAENVFSTRQEPSNAGFHSSSHTGTAAIRAQRVQLAAETEMEVDEDSNGSKRSAQPSTSSEKATDSTAIDLTTDATASKPKSTAPTTVKPTERPQPTQDRLEEALRHMESSSWATRLAAVEYLGKGLDQSSKGGKSEKVDDRIAATFIKHLGDPHYRVAQGVLKHFLPLLKLSTERQQIVPHLKAILPKLFQKFVDTKESIRAIAKENLEYVASAVENSVLTGLVIPMLGDGSNMKVKAAMCHYLRELLPGAAGYMKQGTNTSHMRSFLLKIALLVDAEVPVSVASACGELLTVAARLYGPEMDTALSLLPPSKRVVVSKVLKTRRIVLNVSSQRPPTSVPRSTRSRNGDSEPQNMDTTAEKPERSRKRPESPNANASSPAPSSQKRINTTAQNSENYPEQWRNLVVANPVDELTGNTALLSTAAFSSALFASIPSSEQRSTPFEDVLEVLEQNNASESERKSALYKTFHLIETGSKDLWDQYFDRLLLLLLEAATDKDVHALKVLQRLVEAQVSRTQECFDLVLTRLLVSVGDQVDVARHLMERILRDLVGSASDQQQALTTLTPLISSTEPPTLQVVLRLVKVSLEVCERGSTATTAFLRKPETATRLMEALTLRLGHVSSNVRKNAVDCLVAFHFAAKEDSALLPKYLSAELDDTRRRLVEIFIDRAKMERHHGALAT
ncbi:hypothetical protein BBJ28_00025323 [Nothophytophthora sp. Chile5]|nr:hypothetical protein BBJ28_00025323 [Nothophytophthora sp. Chile5]